MEKKIGVYICSAFGISDAIDCEKLQEDLKDQDGVAVCKVDKDLCTSAGADKIKQDIEAEGLTSVVIGASSSRNHTEIFKFDDVFVDRVNLREGVAWTHEAKAQDTQDLAKDYMMMGLAKVRRGGVPVPHEADIREVVMVVGGGFTGMNAAISASKAGKGVILVEKAAELGGYFKKLYKVTPTRAPWAELQPNTCEALITEVEADPNINILKNCIIEKTTGAPGMFDITVKMGENTIDFQVGTIIQATGWKEYDATKLTEYKYGQNPNIITNVQMEEMAKAGEIKRPSDGGDVKRVVFVQCAGSRDENHLPYCSGFCCMTSLKQAMYVREKYPNSMIYVIYKDLRTPGQYELFYKRVQNEDNIFLTKGEIIGIEEGEDGMISVDVDETLVGENIRIDADLVVLATGMKPEAKIDENTDLSVTDEELAAEEEEKKEEVEAAPKFDMDDSVLKLTYIQGPDLPTLKYGFPDSHYICFPYETRRTGVYAAGAVRAPMDLVASKNDALGASLKAIQCIEAIKEGRAVHPRSGDLAYPDFFFQRCTQCKRCTEECPFSTLDEDIKGTPLPNPTRCRRCGICMGACPERIISFEDYSVGMVSDMIKSIYVPTEEDDGEATPRILAFMCENDAYPALEIISRERMQISPYIRIIPVRCLGSTNISWIADSLSQGFDGVILFGCKYGDDYQCHFIKGSQLANRRMENVQEKLKQLVLEPERVELHMISIDQYREVPDILNNFAKTIEEIGPNPYKEM